MGVRHFTIGAQAPSRPSAAQHTKCSMLTTSLNSTSVDLLFLCKNQTLFLISLYIKVVHCRPLNQDATPSCSTDSTVALSGSCACWRAGKEFLRRQLHGPHCSTVRPHHFSRQRLWPHSYRHRWHKIQPDGVKPRCDQLLADHVR